MNVASLNPPELINDEQLDRMLAGEPVEFQLWLADKLVLRRIHIKGNNVKFHDEVLLHLSERMPGPK